MYAAYAVAESTAWRSIVAGEKPSASAMMATGASLVSSCSVPSRAAQVLNTSHSRTRRWAGSIWRPGE